jgi:hypothetical protein
MKNKESLYKLCKLQKRAARIILNKPFYTPTTEMMQQLRWMPISDYFIYRTIILVFKVLHGFTPDYLNIFRYVHEINSRSTRLRQSNSIYIQKAKTEYFKRSFTIHGSNLWNSIPEFLKHIKTLETFKSAYLHHYFNPRN